MIGPGTELGDFVIEAVAGRGGMGVVYRARQRQPDRVVALKVISAELAHDPEFRTRFQREAAIAAGIEHPNVIPVHAVGEADGTLFIAMRFVVGVDLRSLLVQERRLESRRAAAIVDQVGQALDAAHAHGLVHRDVKPANILIASSGGREHVYLSDFGVARLLKGSETLTGTGGFIGTIDYVAPEQARGERVDSRADVYSLGCVLFQALTGTVPFQIESDLAKLYAHDTQPPPSVLERAPDVPAVFETVLARAMAKQPGDRYLSAGDLGRAAVAASTGEALSRAERSVAVGPAAPAGASPVGSGPTRPREATVTPGDETARRADEVPAATTARSPAGDRGRGRRRLIWAAGGLAAAIVAVVIVILATGGSSSPSVTLQTLVPVQAQDIVPIRHPYHLQTRQITAPGGYAYQLSLDSVTKPPGATANTPLPLYLTLRARKGAMPFVTVERRTLPPTWRWTPDSQLVSFTLDPDPGGTGQVGLSWYVHPGDKTDVTHYITVGPQGIALD